ncbi:MAG: hypothetical protein ACRDD7_13045 [Peptostreptococcaceae bacterium]
MPKLHRIYNTEQLKESEAILFVEITFNKEIISKTYPINKVGPKYISFDDVTPLGKRVPITSIGFVYPIESNSNCQFRLLGSCVPNDKLELVEDLIESFSEKKISLTTEFNSYISNIEKEFKSVLDDALPNIKF